MRGLFQKRWVMILTVAFWASAAFVQVIGPTASSIVPAQKSEVEAAAIDAGDIHRQGVCHHHPQGCPADCLCPKTGFIGEQEIQNVDRSTLSGITAWVECSESRAALMPAFAVYLPEPNSETSIHEISVSFELSDPLNAREILRAPPAKVPIA